MADESQIIISSKRARELFNSLQDELPEDLKDGLSFLDMKNDTLLSYMIDLCNIILTKAKGESIEDHPSVSRCVQYRVILEKLRAIDQRLAYQLNKLVTMPDDVEEEGQRIDVNNLDINIDSNEEGDEDDDDDDNDDADKEEEEKIYKPRKLRSVTDKEGKRSTTNKIYRDLDDASPERVDSKQTEFEEEFYTRVKKNKKIRRRR